MKIKENGIFIKISNYFRKYIINAIINSTNNIKIIKYNTGTLPSVTKGTNVVLCGAPIPVFVLRQSGHCFVGSNTKLPLSSLQ